MTNVERPTGKQALIHTAERLIAERGFHGVAAREVVKESGHKNNSAISYHFGSWDGLLDAVWALHAEPVNAERRVLLDGARAAGNPDLSALVSVYVDPLVHEVARNRPSHWARFNAQWLASTPLAFFGEEVSTAAHSPRAGALFVLGDLLDEVGERLEWLPQGERTRRVSMMCRFVIVALAAAERDDELRENSTRSRAAEDREQEWDSFAAELVTLAAAMLQAH